MHLKVADTFKNIRKQGTWGKKGYCFKTLFSPKINDGRLVLACRYDDT